MNVIHGLVVETPKCMNLMMGVVVMMIAVNLLCALMRLVGLMEMVMNVISGFQVNNWLTSNQPMMHLTECQIIKAKK